MARQPMIEWLFLAFISIAYFVLMNLITAVIVENAFSIAKEDDEQLAIEAERKKMKEVADLGDLFADLDTDGSGEVGLGRGASRVCVQKSRTRLQLRLISRWFRTPWHPPISDDVTVF
ncbi:hypothetical protein FOZ63_018559 [Perkinsus olseni]|uniref:Uncharacterized protein n=1 Tax=Perkinsus olseni TaxID=32597 RepID=A0A7J6UPN8_PEROL|nr:hypothetical protein FOZ63_018559 [Perkinsus olseni]